MWIKKYVIISLLLLTACSTTQQSSDFDSTLYSGKPVESLTNEEPPKTEEEAISRGDKALRDNNIDLALYEYLRSLSFPEAVHKDKTLYTVGRIHLARENQELADRSFRAALAQNPNHIGALASLGTLYTKRGEKDVGKSYFIRALNADQIRMDGVPSINKDNITADSVETFRYDEQSPVAAYSGLGVLYDISGEHDIAQALLRKGLDIDSKNVNALVSLGYSYYMVKAYSKATYFTRAALSIKPGDERAINNLGLIALAKNQPRQALSIFSQHMSEPEALNNVGYFLILKDKPDQAIPYLQQAIDKSPTYYDLANKNLERALEMVRESRDTSTVLLQ